MADRTPTRFNRLQAGENLNTPAAGHVEAFGETVLSQQITVTAANTALNPSTFQIAGIFDIDNIYLALATAQTSGSQIEVGVSATTTRFATFVLTGASAGGGNVRTAATALVADWLAESSAAGTTTVQAIVSGSAGPVSAGAATLTFNYIPRG